jgi:hypothetical protein
VVGPVEQVVQNFLLSCPQQIQLHKVSQDEDRRKEGNVRKMKKKNIKKYGKRKKKFLG